MPFNTLFPLFCLFSLSRKLMSCCLRAIKALHFFLKVYSTPLLTLHSQVFLLDLLSWNLCWQQYFRDRRSFLVFFLLLVSLKWLPQNEDELRSDSLFLHSFSLSNMKKRCCRIKVTESFLLYFSHCRFFFRLQLLKSVQSCEIVYELNEKGKRNLSWGEKHEISEKNKKIERRIRRTTVMTETNGLFDRKNVAALFILLWIFCCYSGENYHRDLLRLHDFSVSRRTVSVETLL
jgi:hypothetical protein